MLKLESIFYYVALCHKGKEVNQALFPPFLSMCYYSLPMVLENSSTPGTGKGTKTSLGSTTQGANASHMLKEQVSDARGVNIITYRDNCIRQMIEIRLHTFL